MNLREWEENQFVQGRQLVVPGEIPIKIGCVGEKGIFAWKFVVFLRGEKIEGNNRRRRKRSQSDEGIIFLCVKGLHSQRQSGFLRQQQHKEDAGRKLTTKEKLKKCKRM